MRCTGTECESQRELLTHILKLYGESRDYVSALERERDALVDASKRSVAENDRLDVEVRGVQIVCPSDLERDELRAEVARLRLFAAYSAGGLSDAARSEYDRMRDVYERISDLARRVVSRSMHQRSPGSELLANDIEILGKLAEAIEAQESK